MSKSFTIFIVDDDQLVQSALASILEDDHTLESFESAEACLARLETVKPNMILLDIGLPGLDGYAFCRLLKDRDDTRDITVTFVSAHDTLEARISGYEAGGDDFVVKPFDVSEVLRKVVVAQRLHDDRARVAEQARSAEELSNVIMASMNDYAVLVSFLGKMAGCTTGDDVGDATMQALANYSLDGVVQIRLKSGAITMSRQGRDQPIEISIMNHVSSMERIFEFKNRAVFNYDHATVMVNNMPLADPDACGRIRDNMAIIAQGIEARLQGIEADHAVVEKQRGIQALLQRVAATISLLKENQRRDQMQASEISFQLQEDLASSFVHLGLTDGQERFLEDLVRRNAAKLLELTDRGAETQSVLAELSTDLQALGR